MPDILRSVSGTRFAVAFLKAQFAARGESAKVATKVPSPRPPKFVKVRQMGAVRANVVQVAPMVLFECWADDDVVAEDLGILAESLITALPDLSPACTRVTDVGGLYCDVDPDSNTPRWIFTKQLYLRAAL